MNESTIEEISPLYDYWKSAQGENDESDRLLKLNRSSPAGYLFNKEPYKWENLYQSIVREIIKGDMDSIKGLRLLLDTLVMEEKEKIINKFAAQKVFSEVALKKLVQKEDNTSPTRKNIFRFLRILFAIYANPYGIHVKGKKIHVYEHTGALIYTVKTRLSTISS